MKEFRTFALASMVVCLWMPLHGQTSSDSKLQQLTQKAYDRFLNAPDSAIVFTRQALTIAVRERNVYYEGHCYYLFSKAYWAKANYRLSMEYGFKALRIFENTQHRQEHGQTLLSVARTLVELGNFASARSFLNQSLEIGVAADDDQLVAETYRELSFWFVEKNMLDSALVYSDKGIALFETLRDALDASILYSRKARIYFMLKDYSKSREFALKGLALDTLVKNYRGLAVSYFQVAQNDIALNKLKDAKQNLLHSIRISRSMGNLTWLVRAHDLLGHVYSKSNQSALAADHYLLASQLKDSLYNSERSGQIEEMRSLYELEGKESKIKILEQENTLKQQEVKSQQLFVAFLLVGVLLLLALLFFLVRLRLIQRKTNIALSTKNVAIEQQREEMQVQAEKLQQLNLLQTKLFSVISHDLRGPIGNLQSLLDLLSRQLLTPEEFNKISDKLRSNLNVTQRTLENMLNWALSQMDGIKTEKRILDVGQCVEEAWRLMEESASRKRITINKQWKHVHLASADPDQVQLVLRNLLHNAIKFSKIGDEIQVSISEDHSYCTVCIQDQGIGMSQQEIDLVSGSTRHFTKVGTQQEKGTGLGLLLCKEFTERNEGKLNIRSENGKGTKVCFSLPVA